MSEKGYMTLGEIVRSLLADEGRNTMHRFLPYLHYGISGVKDWNQDVCYEVKTKKLKLDAKLCVDYPDDYLNWVCVGAKVGDRLVAFFPDNTITSHQDRPNVPNEPFYKEWHKKAYPEYTFFNYIEDDLLTAHIAGLRYPGYFKELRHCQQFQFSSDITEEYIYLEYISTGFEAGAKTLVSAQVEDVVKNYIRWKYASNKYGQESARAQICKREYLEEVDEVAKRNTPFNYKTLNEAIRRHFTQKPRT